MLIDFASKLNAFGAQRVPFFFVIDYAAKHFYAAPLDALDPDILYQCDQHTNVGASPCHEEISWQASYPHRDSYLHTILTIIEEIKAGNTYLLNFTAPTKLTLSCDLKTIFHQANALFKLYFKDRFVCFSPERFVRIEGNTIRTYPMKGTIDATIENAEAIILDDEKEKAEHVMVVDLLRNDLSMVASNVRVERFRYVDKIQAGDKELLQISSQIAGTLSPHWHEHIGDILLKLLPAGSISGTPKRKSVEIIEALEGYDRGFFTGVFGIYDGHVFESGVMIRFIEKEEDGYVFKSGGGITLLSDPQKEYDELCDKVYIPVF